MEIIEWITKISILITAVTFVVSLLIDERKEFFLSRLVFSNVFANTILIISAFFVWAFSRFPSFNIYVFSLLENQNDVFSINFIWDVNTFVFLFTGNAITLLIVHFSRYYMHREDGYKRFFNTIIFFYWGYSFTVMSGNFITLFTGWECLGLASFLLVAFYRDRYLPVRNAVKVFSVYRIGDVGLILAMWALHHVFHENVLFFHLTDEQRVALHFRDYYWLGMLIAFCLFIASLGKSAQFPFSYWLPRAMEGPTPSSAIFYGSLSVHIGILLLIRTYSIWETQWLPRILFIVLGVITVFTASTSARLQSSIKAQIAYSSIVQIGIMYIELAFGLKWLVLIHFVSNAFLRTYQLLLSPSMATYLIRQQMYFSKLIRPMKNSFSVLPDRIYYTIFVLSQKEWHLDYYVNYYLFGKLKKVGEYFSFINAKNLWIYSAPLFLSGAFFYFKKVHFYVLIEYYLPVLYSASALILTLRSFSERNDPLFVIYSIFISQLLILLAIFYNENFGSIEASLYLSGVLVGFSICTYLLVKLKNGEKQYFGLNKYYGHVHTHKAWALIYLLGVLAMIGFPITPTFIGEDLILEHIHPHQYFLTVLFALHFVIVGITGIRTYARLFLGPPCKAKHEVAIKSA